MGYRSAASSSLRVALLAEGVGRNLGELFMVLGLGVALLAEGVGRNLHTGTGRGFVLVALLAEGVGRNRPSAYGRPTGRTSPSSRRAWVEIPRLFGLYTTATGRPPRGGRG